MPRIDGRLYPSEVAALKAEAERDKPKAKRGRPPKVKPEAIPEAKPERPEGAGSRGPVARVAGILAAAADELKPRDALGVFSGKAGAVRLKVSAEVIEGIAAEIRSGMPIDKSCILHGISRAYYEKWKAANPAIFAYLEQAELEHESKLVKIVAEAAPKDWKAGNWLLERRHAWIAPQRTDPAVAALAGGIATLHKSLLDKVAGAKKVEPIEVHDA
jgi:hypothetical protein